MGKHIKTIEHSKIISSKRYKHSFDKYEGHLMKIRFFAFDYSIISSCLDGNETSLGDDCVETLSRVTHHGEGRDVILKLFTNGVVFENVRLVIPVDKDDEYLLLKRGYLDYKESLEFSLVSQLNDVINSDILRQVLNGII